MNPQTYSISVRLQRLTTEYAYVRVPVTGDIMAVDPSGGVALDENGNAHIDPQRMVQRAVELARSPGVTWYQEQQQVQLHPLQKAPEPGETSL